MMSMIAMRKHRGVSLIEVLIALVILSIGLLGVAGLQGISMRNNHSAYLRTQATLVAYDITDRMRANRAAALAGAYDINLGGTPAGATVAALDLIDWKNMLDQALPAGDGSVAVDGNGIATIVVEWDDSRGEDERVQFVTETQL